MKELTNDVIKEKLNSEDASEKIEAIEVFFDKELTDEFAVLISELIADENKGVRNAASTILNINQNPLVYKSIVKKVSSPDITIRNLAGEILIKAGSLAVESCVDFIDQGNDDDKKFVIDVLGLIGDPEAAPKIHEVLKVNKHPNVILACLESLGRLSYSVAFEDICAKYTENELFKPTVIEALGSLGTDEALNFIVDKFNDEDVLTRYSLIESLGHLGNEESVQYIVNNLENFEEVLFTPAVTSLAKLAAKYNVYPQLNDKLKKAINISLVEGKIEDKINAISLIGDCKDKEMLKILFKQFGNNPELDEHIKPKLIESPVFTLNSISKNLIEKHEKELSLLYLVKEVIINKGEIFGEEYTESDIRNLSNSIAETLTHPDEEVRRTAMELVFVLDLETGILFLDAMMNDDNIWNRMRLLEILEELEDPRALEAIRKMESDHEAMVNERAKHIINNKSIS